MSRQNQNAERQPYGAPYWAPYDLAAWRGGGGAAPVTYATWNPDDKSAGVSLSNGDLTSAAGGGWWAVRATIGVTDGDWFFQQVVDDNIYIQIAVAAADATLTYPGDGSSKSWGISDHGYNYYPGGYTSNGVTLSNGDIVGCAILRSTSQAKFYKYSGGAWSLVYTADISSIDGDPVYPMFSGLDGTCTANFGASSFAAAVPDGANEGVYS